MTLKTILFIACCSLPMTSFLAGIDAADVFDHHSKLGSCLAIKRIERGAPSGEYIIQTSAERKIKVFCEMGLNHGGYTFLRPTDLARLTNGEVQAMFNDKKSFLMRVRKASGSQPYAVLNQLPQYASSPLKLGLNDNAGYATAVNVPHLGKPYLYYGFIPVDRANNNNEQGLLVNGHYVRFRNCDKNPNSYIALFPNFSEYAPTNYLYSIQFPFCDRFYSLFINPPSGRVMPNGYFTFFETHWGGCGCYSQSDSRLNRFGIESAAIGFR
jgi:hypothetical protein